MDTLCGDRGSNSFEDLDVTPEYKKTRDKLKAKLKKQGDAWDKTAQEIKAFRGEMEFPCGCGANHKFNECVAVQTHWYTRPYSCSEGDYWNEGELQIICPDSEERNRNRLLFHSGKEGSAIENRFKNMYKPCFKEVVEEHKENESYSFWNNYDMRDHPEDYDLG